jgi:peptidoglycan/LPS O-acetylase OafA/YrhL
MKSEGISIMTHSQQDIGRRIGAATLIGVGALFLLGQVTDFDVFGFIWPFFVILPGAAFLFAAFNGDKNAAGLAVPGALVTGTGGILLYQNMTGHWESWAYIWALYPVFLGLALTYVGRRTDNEGTYKAGRGFVRWGGIAFIVMWAIFELAIFSGDRPFGHLLLPLVLIGAGVILLFRGTGDKPKRDSVTIFTGPKVVTIGKAKNGYVPHASDKLRQEIDAALAEDDEHPPTV